MILIIAEKPSMARAIATGIGGFQSKEGYMVNANYHLTWAVGHLVELVDPDYYIGEKRRWNFNDLPVIPEFFKLKVNPKTKDQFNVISKLLKTNQYTAVINACDAGREGELIFKYIYQLTGCKLPIKRLWISSLTESDVRKGFNNLLDGKAKENLGQAAYCRAEADWLIGMNGTRAMTVKHGQLLTVGRVQTPTLALIVKREMEILNFQPVPYWEVDAWFCSQGKQYKGTYINKDNKTRLDKPEAELVFNSTKDQVGTVVKVEVKPEKANPPLLFDLTSLQKECIKKFGLTAKKTLDIAQVLYEKYKLISYPRTESKYLATSQIPTFSTILNNLSLIADINPLIKPLLNNDLPVSKRIVDDSKLTDHHAIIPTLEKPVLSGLDDMSVKVYKLIASRFVAAFYPELITEKTTVITDVKNCLFRTTGKRIIKPGWTVVFPQNNEENEGEEKEAVLPKITEGERYQVKDIKLLAKKTEKPSPYSEDAILGLMETAGKLIEDETLKEQMKGMSLGTPATRATIIEGLIKHGYIIRKSKKLLPTDTGLKLIELVPIEEMKQAELTALWEKRLSEIEGGRDHRSRFMSDMKTYTEGMVKKIAGQESQKQSFTEISHNKSVIKPCKCGGELVIKKAGVFCSKCSFKRWRRIASKDLTDTQLRILILKGITGQINGFKNSKQEKFNAKLKMNENTGEVSFVR